MTAPFACHVFAHKDGRYQTVSSFGTDPLEIKALEQFFFGQTNDPGYLRSLRAEPGVIWRRIGGRIALTRVTQGAPDSNGRSTLSFETLLDADRGTPLARSVAQVILGHWEITNTGVRVTPSPAGGTLPLNPAEISRVALAVRDGKRVLHPAKAFSLRDVAAVIESCAAEPGFSLCFKSLNNRAPVTVNLVFRNISERTMPTSPPARTNPLPRTNRPMRERPSGPGSNTPVLLAICAVLVVQTIFVWRATSASSVPGTWITMQDNIISQLKDKYQRHADQIEKLQQSLLRETTALNKSASEHASALKQAKQTLDALDQRLHVVADRVNGLRKVLVERADKGDKAVESIKEAVASVGREVNAIQAAVRELRELQKTSEAETRFALDVIKARLPEPTEADGDQPDRRSPGRKRRP